MIIEEPLNVPRRPLWLKIMFTCFILNIGASIPSTLYLRQPVKDEILDRHDRILVVSRGYEGYESSYLNSFTIHVLLCGKIACLRLAEAHIRTLR